MSAETSSIENVISKLWQDILQVLPVQITNPTYRMEM